MGGLKWLWAFVDLLLALVGILGVVVFALAVSVNPPAASSVDAVTPPGNMIVSIAWPEGSTDVDLWVIGPGEPIAVGYSHKSGKLFDLVRDDLGTVNDTSPLNFETAFARGLPAGRYVVNIHGYGIKETTPVHVEIRMGASASMSLLLSTSMDLRPGQERTVASFMVGADGRVVPGSLNQVYVPLRSEKK